MNAIPLKKEESFFQNPHPFVWWRESPEFPVICKRHSVHIRCLVEGHYQTKYEFFLDSFKRTFLRTCKHTYLWSLCPFNSELHLFLQNFTFNDDFSPSSTSSADLSGLGTEPKTPGLSQSLALSSDEVCPWHAPCNHLLRSYI